MNRISQHIPGWADGIKPQVAEFETVEQLLAVSWVASWRTKAGFVRFSQHRGKLMVELHQGRMWYVVGHLNEVVVGIDEWAAKPQGKEDVV